MQDSELKPAKYDADAKSEFGPRFPWKIVVPLLLSAILGVSFYFYREAERREAFRRALSKAYSSSVLPAKAPVEEFRSNVENKILKAIQNPPKEVRNPKLRLSALLSMDGVYVRVNAATIKNQETLRASLHGKAPDAIGRCLGIAPLSLRTLYNRFTVVDDKFVQSIADTPDLLGLKVIDRELSLRAARDIPVLVRLAQSDYLMLVVERGASRKTAPVGIYLWDLKREELLLAGEVEANGALISARIGGSRSQDKPLADSGGAIDCSIASGIKELAGRDKISVENENTVVPTAGGAVTPIVEQDADVAPTTENTEDNKNKHSNKER